MSCFVCIRTNSKICGGSCGLCGCDCPGHVPEGPTDDDYSGTAGVWHD